jgi:hypothetical protein
MASMVAAAIGSPEYPSFGGPSLVRREHNSHRKCAGLDRCLDRISSGIYENAVALRRTEHEQLVRLAAAFSFGERLTRLREELGAIRATRLHTAPSAEPQSRPTLNGG